MSTSTHATTVLIAGGTGFIGTALSASLRSRGYEVITLVRSAPRGADQRQWDPARRQIDRDLVEQVDVVINLAGASIAGGWWTAKRKNLILQSRLDSTSTLAAAIAAAERKPAVFVSGSAVGYYGDRADMTLTEASSKGEMYLSDVCDQWEHAADPARESGVRVVHPRLGVVLNGKGGMLPLIAIPFKVGVGGKIGGNQYMAWVDLDDLVNAFHHIIDHEEFAGPVNVVAPESTTNAQFTKAMGKALHRPTIIPVPKAAASLAGGQLADELLLPDQHVVPQKLLESGFVFDFPDIESALGHAFGHR